MGGGAEGGSRGERTGPRGRRPVLTIDGETAPYRSVGKSVLVTRTGLSFSLSRTKKGGGTRLVSNPRVFHPSSIPAAPLSVFESTVNPDCACLPSPIDRWTGINDADYSDEVLQLCEKSYVRLVRNERGELDRKRAAISTSEDRLVRTHPFPNQLSRPKARIVARCYDMWLERWYSCASPRVLPL